MSDWFWLIFAFSTAWGRWLEVPVAPLPRRLGYVLGLIAILNGCLGSFSVMFSTAAGTHKPTWINGVMFPLSLAVLTYQAVYVLSAGKVLRNWHLTPVKYLLASGFIQGLLLLLALQLHRFSYKTLGMLLRDMQQHLPVRLGEWLGVSALCTVLLWVLDRKAPSVISQGG